MSGSGPDALGFRFFVLFALDASYLSANKKETTSCFDASSLFVSRLLEALALFGCPTPGKTKSPY